VTLIDCDHRTPPAASTGYPYIAIPQIRNGHIQLDGVRRISSEHFAEWTRKLKPQANDVLVVRRCSSGDSAVVPPGLDCAIGQNLVVLRSNGKRVLPEFLRWLVNTPEWWEQVGKFINVGAVFDSLKCREIPHFRLTVPPIEAQREIATLLGALDNRITLLRETNATLEAIAQALFKSWFVDFDPVHAKQQGIAPEGMDEATAALFPDSFEESELGLVPKGWKVGTLASVATLNPESWTVKNHPQTLAYIDLANAKDNEIAAVTDYLFDEAPSRARRVLRSGDTIVGTVRPGNRSFAFIHQAGNNLTASTGFAVLRPNMKINTEFVYLDATQDSSIEHLAHVADGGAYPAVRPEVVAGMQCILPSREVMEAFHGVTAPLLASVAENQKKAQTVSTLRDTLLPRLISGKLRLPEAEALAA
jgi:type I restriction enzyme S subunit